MFNFNNKKTKKVFVSVVAVVIVLAMVLPMILSKFM